MAIACGNGCGGCNVEPSSSSIDSSKGSLGAHVSVGDIDGTDGLEDNVGVTTILDSHVCVVVSGPSVSDEPDNNNGHGHPEVSDVSTAIELMCINANDPCVTSTSESIKNDVRQKG